MRKHECSSLSLTAPQGLQTCRTIDYPRSPSNATFSCSLRVLPTVTAFVLPVPSVSWLLPHKGYRVSPRGGGKKNSFSRAWKCQLDFSNSIERLLCVPSSALPELLATPRNPPHWGMEFLATGKEANRHIYT